VNLLGAKFMLRAHFADVRDRVVCVGIDLRSFESEIRNGREHIELQDWTDELNSPRWRALPVSESIESVRRLLSDSIAASLNYPELSSLQTEQDREEMRHALTLMSKPASGTRKGRTPVLTDEVLAGVVAPAYRSAGRRPVQAVQAALTAAGAPGAGPSGEVTIDQARKAVARARAQQLIPPAAKKGKP